MNANEIILRLGGVGILTPDDIPDLKTQTGKILALMSDGLWHSSWEIYKAGGGYESMRRLRELRQLNPNYVVDRR